MKTTRLENIAIINSLYGLDQDLLNDSIGYKGNRFENYTDSELERFAEVCQQFDDYATEMFLKE